MSVTLNSGCCNTAVDVNNAYIEGSTRFLKGLKALLDSVKP